VIPALHLVERNLLYYRHGWLVIFSGFFEPLHYLLGIGYGAGSLVGTVNTGPGRTMSYAMFVAPALMASSAMNGGIYETTFNFFGKLKYQKLYDAVLATPLGVDDVALGEVTFAVMRGSLYAFAFIIVMAALGLVASPLALLAIPAALLIGFAFACVGVAATSFVRKWQDFDLILLLILPLFLFSATFYPISAYPPALQTVVELTPLYHGVDLVRQLTTGFLSLSALVDVGYLALISLLGLWIASRRLERMLLK
jgi:lipooligosaccharide transport system permease protein